MMAQLEHIEAIENRLWRSADNLRANSNYASNEYFLPVMGLIFLRHAYSRYLAVKDEIEAGLPKRGGKTPLLTPKDFSTKGAIFLRPEAQFDSLVNLPDSANRAQAIIDAMDSIAADYETLKGGVAEHVRKRENFAFETTLSGRTYARMIPIWQEAGYRVKLIFLSLPSVDLAIARVAARVAQGGHGVPEDVIRRRFVAGQRNFDRIYKPLVDYWVLYDNSRETPQLTEEGCKP